MTFERSPEGIANRALFFNADYVAYHEGTNDDEFSIDRIFWQNTFADCKPDVRVRFIASGPKSQVVSIFQRAAETTSDKSIFLIDRDFDDIQGCIIRDRRIFYTHGYSVENDVVSAESVKLVVQNHLPLKEIVDRSEEFTREYINNSDRLLKVLCRVDQLARIHSVSGIGSKSIEKYLKDHNFGHPPVLCPHAIKSEVNRVRCERGLTAIRILGASDRNWKRRLNGHLLVDFYYKIFMAFMSTFFKKFRIDKQTFLMQVMAASMRSGVGSLASGAGEYYMFELNRLP